MSMQANEWTVPQRQSPIALLLILFRVVRNMVKTFWPLLLLYMVRGNKSFDNWEIILALLPAFLLVRAFLEFMFYRFTIQSGELVIRKGILQKQTIAIPLNKIQAVHLEQSFVHTLLGASKISFDSTGSEKIEVKIDALKTPRANALKEYILSVSETSTVKEEGVEKPDEQTLITLRLSDLFKLSFSSNHIEAFFILLGFLFSMLENLKELVKDRISALADEATAYLVTGSAPVFIFLILVVLIVSVVVSTGRTFLTYFNFFISRTENSYRIRSGLLNIKEKVLPFNKVQFISWRANFIRRKIGIFLLQFHSVGNDQVKDKQQIKVPVTQPGFISVLSEHYHPLLTQGSVHTISPAYVWRRVILVGIPLVIILIAVGYNWMGWASLWLLLILPYIYINAKVFVRRFRLTLDADALHIHRGVWGTHEQLLRWGKVQKITIRQSVYQQNHDLANIYLHTAGGILLVPYLDLTLAQQIMDYGLYKIESENESWI